MSYEVQVPSVDAAVIAPNPVNMNTSFSLSVSLSEKIVTLEPYYYYSGDIHAGEV